MHSVLRVKPVSSVPRITRLGAKEICKLAVQHVILGSAVNLAMRSQCCVYKYYLVMFACVFMFRLFTIAYRFFFFGKYFTKELQSEGGMNVFVEYSDMKWELNLKSDLVKAILSSKQNQNQSKQTK